MAKAVCPGATPDVPDGATGWRRNNRAGAMYHAHLMGHPICGSRVYFDRHKSSEPRDLGDFQYWGVCPRCYNKQMSND